MLESPRAMVVAFSLSVMFITAIAPGQTATLLRGYVSHDQEQSEARSLTNSQQDTAARALSGPANAGSFPATFEGSWHCITVVTDSTLDSVADGQQTESEILFSRAADGRIGAKWNQSGWVEAQTSVTAWSPTEAQIDRTDYYYGENVNGSWAARSRDRFTQLDSDRMVAQSYVDQYINGQFTGRYRTKSTLYREVNQRNVAAATPGQ